jgi:hypothetical protein
MFTTAPLTALTISENPCAREGGTPAASTFVPSDRVNPVAVAEARRIAARTPILRRRLYMFSPPEL